MSLNKNITLCDEARIIHQKASEEYVHVIFKYPDEGRELDILVPVKYRRTGVDIPENDKEALNEYLNKVYEQMRPSKYPTWLETQDGLWKTSKAPVTKQIFDQLKDSEWHCASEINNPNYARRIQDLKDMGYTIVTLPNYKRPDSKTKKETRLLLLPLKRVEGLATKYETISPKLRKRIVECLKSIDVYENKYSRNCLPDHKFPEIRWDENTWAKNPDDMSDEQITDKFQLLTNQRNLQKREVCRNCYQTGNRGTIYGIPYFYEGGPEWDASIPRKGKAAEEGCKGCPWYDLAKWRKELNKLIAKKQNAKNS